VGELSSCGLETVRRSSLSSEDSGEHEAGENATVEIGNMLSSSMPTIGGGSSFSSSRSDDGWSTAKGGLAKVRLLLTEVAYFSFFNRDCNADCCASDGSSDGNEAVEVWVTC